MNFGKPKRYRQCGKNQPAIRGGTLKRNALLEKNLIGKSPVKGYNISKESKEFKETGGRIMWK